MSKLIGGMSKFAIKRYAAGVVSEAIRIVHQAPTKRRRILMYHSVGNMVDGDEYRIYSMTPGQFASQMETVQETAKSLSIKIDAFGAANNDNLSITFDDGYVDALTVVAPLLCDQHIPFHIFVSSARMNGHDTKYLTARQVAEISTMPGVTIGAHGATHRSLTEMSRDDLTVELVSSKQELEDVLQKPVTTMSYPFGDVNSVVRQAAIDAGFTCAATSQWGFNNHATDMMQQRRIDMWTSDSGRIVENKVLGHWNWFGYLS